MEPSPLNTGTALTTKYTYSLQTSLVGQVSRGFSNVTLQSFTSFDSTSSDALEKKDVLTWPCAASVAHKHIFLFSQLHVAPF